MSVPKTRDEAIDAALARAREERIAEIEEGVRRATPVIVLAVMEALRPISDVSGEGRENGRN